MAVAATTGSSKLIGADGQAVATTGRRESKNVDYQQTTGAQLEINSNVPQSSDPPPAPVELIVSPPKMDFETLVKERFQVEGDWPKTHLNVATGHPFTVLEKQKEFWTGYCDEVAEGRNPHVAELTEGKEAVQLGLELNLSFDRKKVPWTSVSISTLVLVIDNYVQHIIGVIQEAIKQRFKLTKDMSELLACYLRREDTSTLLRGDSTVDYSGRVIFPYAKIKREFIQEFHEKVMERVDPPSSHIGGYSPTYQLIVIDTCLLYGSSRNDEIPPMKLIEIYGYLNADVKTTYTLEKVFSPTFHSAVKGGAISQELLIQKYQEKGGWQYWLPLFFSNEFYDTLMEPQDPPPDPEDKLSWDLVEYGSIPNYKWFDWCQEVLMKIFTDSDQIEQQMIKLKTVLAYLDKGVESVFLVKLDKGTSVQRYPALMPILESRFLRSYDAATNTHKSESLKSLILSNFQRYTYADMEFMPYSEKTEKPTSRYVNMFHGFKAKRVENPVNISFILNHHRDIYCNGDVTMHEFRLDYYAQMIQYPNKKPDLAFIDFSFRKGTSKNMWAEWWVNKIIGPEHAIIIDNLERITARFNGPVAYKLLVVGDEITNKRTKDIQQLKSMVTRNSVEIEYKGKEIITLADCSRVWFLTNHYDAMKLEPGDRRFCVNSVNEKYGRELDGSISVDSVEYHKRLASELTQEAADSFYTFLMDRDISKFEPRIFPITEARLSMIEATEEAPAVWLRQFDWTAEIPSKVHLGMSEVVQLTPGSEVKAADLFLRFCKWRKDHMPRDKTDSPRFTPAIKRAVLGIPGCPPHLEVSRSNTHGTWFIVPNYLNRPN